jgi:hypothetical protein
MAEKMYLYIPEDITFMRPPLIGQTVEKPMMELVLVDPDADIGEGEQPETKLVPVSRSFAFFVENFICTHPIFDLRRGHGAYASGLRLLDKSRQASPGTWAEFDADDLRKMKKVFSDPPQSKKENKDMDLSAAGLREMSKYEQVQFRSFIESCMNPRTTPPEDAN